MEELIKIIEDFAPGLATFLFIIVLILKISDDWDKIVKFIKEVCNISKHIDVLLYSKKRERMNKTLSSKEYLEWQLKVLKKIYKNPIKTLSEEYNVNAKITSLPWGTEGKEFTEYEAVTISFDKPIDFPFKGVCEKKNLKTKDFYERKAKKRIKNKKFEREYYHLVKATLRYPNRVGYMFDEIEVKNNVKIKAHVATYVENVLSSHILEYELYKTYINRKKREKIEKSVNPLEYLHLRESIHSKCDGNILLNGAGRESLLSVQMFVIVKNRIGGYDVLKIRRSANVSAKANFLQFIPSGGFEAMNDCNDFDSQWDNYSIPKVLFRELLEECFGQSEDDNRTSGNNISPECVYSNKIISKILNDIQNKADSKVKLQMIGLALSLVGLRQELCFILKLDDEEYAKYIEANYESNASIHFVNLLDLEDEKYWTNYLTAGMSDIQLINSTSASLFELARSSEIYKECQLSMQTNK